MTLNTRRPTGKPAWPILLLAGREKAGKSWAAITASASPLVGRTLYIGIGEDDPDEYSLIPGADFEIVVHDGTYPGILNAVNAAINEPVGEKPTLIIVDSMTRLWNLISDNMQAIANRRAKGRKNANGDFTVSADLWNTAANQWQDVMDALRVHQGPAIVTARLDSVAVMENGQPTAQKEWKVQAHKSLVFDATAVIEMRERGQFLLTGVKSARLQLERPRPFPDFTVDTLWAQLGISDGTGDRTHAAVNADHTGADPLPPARVRINTALTALSTAQDLASLSNVWKRVEDGGLDGIEELVNAHTAMQTALTGTTEPDKKDEWALEPPVEGTK